MSGGVDSKKAKLAIGPLILGVVAAQKLTIGGEVYVGEILSLIYLIANARSIRLLGPLKALMRWGFVWALCQLLSDVVNQTPALDSMKGVGAPLVLLCTLVCLSNYFIRHVNHVPSLLLGAQFGIALQLFLSPSEPFIGNPWKWGMGPVAAEIFAIYVTFFARKPRWQLGWVVALIVAVSLQNDSRSLPMFVILAALCYLLAERGIFQAVIGGLYHRWGALGVSLIFAIALLTINFLTTALLSSQAVLQKLPDDSARKFEVQARGQYGILLGGRNESLVSIDAFLEKPLLGHGSWAKDDGRYQYALWEKSTVLGYVDGKDFLESGDLIPVHSYLMGGLVWAGIGGGVFWIYILRWLLDAFVTRAPDLGFYFFAGPIAMSWNILFSPFGASSRWATALFLAALICFSELLRRRNG